MKHILIKAVILGFALMCILPSATAQRRKVNFLPKYDLEPYHFGFILAVNEMKLTWKPTDHYQDIEWMPSDAPDITVGNATMLKVREITSIPKFGFAVGIVGNLRLGNYFDLRFIPTLGFGDRYFDYRIDPFTISGDTLQQITIRKSLSSTVVDLPFHVKYRSKRLNNFAAYVLAGGKYSIEMASNKKINSVNGNYPIKVNRNDIAAEVGFGVDFYTPYFKFGVETKMSYGIKNILVKDQYLYSQSLDRINNKVFQLSFTFE